MNSLFIIGNGFDIDHGLKTSYEDFHKYLKETYSAAKVEELIVPEPKLLPNGNVEYKDRDIINFLLYLINNAEGNGEWSELEKSLGVLNFDKAFKKVPDKLDKDGDIDIGKKLRDNKALAKSLILPARSIVDYFSEWIDTINIDNKIKIKSNFENIIDKDSDYFLTFNYTKTLEILYKVKNVCHIHGMQGEKLLFGHGNDRDYYEENMRKNIGSEGPLKILQDSLRKNTNKAINDNKSFFNSINNSIDKIYSYGFAFGEVDRIYITEIFSRINTKDVTWYLNDFDELNKRKQYEDIIKKCGFCGKFSTYHI